MVQFMLQFHSIFVQRINLMFVLDLTVVCVCFQESGGSLDSQIESLLNVEKQMRLNGDVAGTKKAAIDILQLCFEARAWKTLNDQIVVLSKRRGQLKQVVFFLVFFCSN
ncbi:putative 26S Proteasome non-ATPase regulatory subunit 12/COP9 signalosome complex subunit 4 [Helianthus annuus]|nr:putative 26S Proteasome non-ATPase regulatory subunit 12/COP9 signalosome complex subunit 4 [Helianthus annuus]